MTIQTLEPHLIDSLRQSAQEIFETMVFLTPTAIDAAVEDHSTFGDAVIGLLGFTGTRSGTFVVRTDEEMAKTIAADGFGELVNMLAGNFKNAWVAAGNQMELSVPNVIHNGEVSLKSNDAGALRSRVHVALECGQIDIGVHFEPQY